MDHDDHQKQSIRFAKKAGTTNRDRACFTLCPPAMGFSAAEAKSILQIGSDHCLTYFIIADGDYYRLSDYVSLSVCDSYMDIVA